MSVHPARRSSPESTLSRAVSSLTSRCLDRPAGAPQRHDRSAWNRIEAALFGSR
ncbi:MAG: hypothetical protein HY815_14540 [Candidatus Riflebacteria bacterium]|nr:hypothetical protein [Candidatus Riflebacteria bacterium]